MKRFPWSEVVDAYSRPRPHDAQHRMSAHMLALVARESDLIRIALVTQQGEEFVGTPA